MASNLNRNAALPEERDTAVPTEAADVDLGLTQLPALEVPTRCSRIRRDTTMLQPVDLQAGQDNAEAKLQKLASTPATKRKFDRLDKSDEEAQLVEETAFVIANLESVNELFCAVKCTICGGDVHVEKCDREYGLAVKLMVVCANCGKIAAAWSSPRVDGIQKMNPFAVNILAARAMQTTGNRQAALNNIFSTMNISHRGLHKKTWQGYVKQKLTPAEKVTSESARSVCELYRELDIANPGNIAVSYDGLWMTRGHSSHIGVGVVIELFTGLVIDYVVLSNFCAGCERGPKEGDPAYEAWHATHTCQKNTEKKSGEMEVEAALILFERSLQKNGVRYTTILCGDDC